MPGPGKSSKFMQRCVADVMNKGKDKEGAFAICTAQSQRAGYTEPGSKRLTGKGKKAEKKFAKKDDMPAKAAEFEKQVKGEEVEAAAEATIEEQPQPSLRTILEGIAARASKKIVDTTE